MRTALLLLVIVVVGLSSAPGVGAVDPEVSEFLLHRQVILSVDFSSGSARLSDEARMRLDEAVNDLRSLLGREKVIRVEGHASRGGDEQMNLMLSMRRAMEVRAYLLSQYGLDFDLFFNGYGSNGPSAKTVVELASYDDTLGVTEAPVDSVVTR